MKSWVGDGNGGACDGCDVPITTGEIYHQLDFPDGLTVRFHARAVIITAELPTCAVCRVRILPGQNVVFRIDGRVKHSECPKVLCPVCTGIIEPGQPIRRDGEQLVHGNCWIRRPRADHASVVAAHAIYTRYAWRGCRVTRCQMAKQC